MVAPGAASQGGCPRALPPTDTRTGPPLINTPPQNGTQTLIGSQTDTPMLTRTKPRFTVAILTLMTLTCTHHRLFKVNLAKVKVRRRTMGRSS